MPASARQDADEERCPGFEVFGLDDSQPTRAAGPISSVSGGIVVRFVDPAQRSGWTPADLRQFREPASGAAAAPRNRRPQPNGRRLGGPSQRTSAVSSRGSTPMFVLLRLPLVPIRRRRHRRPGRGDLEGLAGAPQPLATWMPKAADQARPSMPLRAKNSFVTIGRRVTARGVRGATGPRRATVSAWSRRANPAGADGVAVSPARGQSGRLGHRGHYRSLGPLLTRVRLHRGVADGRPMPLAAGWPCSVGWR